MAILVTGSAGHLGEALMRTLRESGEQACGIDILPSEFTNYVGSVCDRDFVRENMRGARIVLHAATLHKPHLATHTNQQFVDTNFTGTLVLLEEAVAAGIDAFIFTSTTSAFGAALTPAAGEPAAWIAEDVPPIPKNIYGVTKVAAENLCELFARQRGLPVLILRTSRFFPEADDDPAVSGAYETANAQANEMLYRRVDIEDVVAAHLLATRKAPQIGFGRYIISATTPFSREDLVELRRDAPAVVRRLFPDSHALYAARQWQMFPQVDRVYVNQLALQELGWQPKYDFRYVLESLKSQQDFRSALALQVGSKGYHATGSSASCSHAPQK
jgi:UDP-glucose 4-epimerase